MELKPAQEDTIEEMQLVSLKACNKRLAHLVEVSYSLYNFM
jgi:hypothetical protein